MRDKSDKSRPFYLHLYIIKIIFSILILLINIYLPFNWNQATIFTKNSYIFGKLCTVFSYLTQTFRENIEFSWFMHFASNKVPKYINKLFTDSIRKNQILKCFKVHCTDCIHLLMLILLNDFNKF